MPFLHFTTLSFLHLPVSPVCACAKRLPRLRTPEGSAASCWGGSTAVWRSSHFTLQGCSWCCSLLAGDLHHQRHRTLSSVRAALCTSVQGETRDQPLCLSESTENQLVQSVCAKRTTRALLLRRVHDQEVITTVAWPFWTKLSVLAGIV